MNFWKSLFSSALGTILGLGGGALLLLLLMLLIGTCSGEKTEAEPNSVLILDLKDGLPELSNNSNDNNNFDGDLNSIFSTKIGLNDALKVLEVAQNDPKIKGIFLNFDGSSTMGIGLASMSKLRQALDSFKTKDKFVIAYSNTYSQRAYYLASVADKVYINPQGGMEFGGFGASLLFFKGMMDKLGVKAQIFYAGKFKSATEPFRRTDMSDENRLQVREYLEGMYGLYLDAISKSRGIEVAQLRALADSLAIRKPQNALDAKLVDGLKYRDEVIDELYERTGVANDKKLETLNLQAYYELKKSKIEAAAKDQVVAVIVAQGEIVDGEGEKGKIGGEYYARLIRKIRKDKSVKAIVLRINSGGGSALASELIWRELELAKAQNIRVVASMGDVAASGGYYIACGTERIFAEPLTLTGSIGVFGMIPNWRELFEQKLGLSMDSVKTTAHSTMDGTFFGFDEHEGRIIQESVDDIYMLFKQRVGMARHMELDAVDEIAQGRVWTGVKAKEIGLVDALGGTQEAIESAASLANLSEYAVVWYPQHKEFSFASLLSGEGESDPKVQAKVQAMSRAWQVEQLGPLAPAWRELQRIKEMEGVQMRLPYELQIH